MPRQRKTPKLLRLCRSVDEDSTTPVDLRKLWYDYNRRGLYGEPDVYVQLSFEFSDKANVSYYASRVRRNTQNDEV